MCRRQRRDGVNRIEQSAFKTPAGRVASRLLVENLREAAEEIRARYLDRKSEYPADWQAAAGETFSVAHVTPDELRDLRE